MQGSHNLSAHTSSLFAHRTDDESLPVSAAKVRTGARWPPRMALMAHACRMANAVVQDRVVVVPTPLANAVAMSLGLGVEALLRLHAQRFDLHEEGPDARKQGLSTRKCGAFKTLNVNLGDDGCLAVKQMRHLALEDLIERTQRKRLTVHPTAVPVTPALIMSLV